MSSTDRSVALTALARGGFADLDAAGTLLDELAETTGRDRDELFAHAAVAADPDLALTALVGIARRDPHAVGEVLASPTGARAAWAVMGGSRGFGEFFARRPECVRTLIDAGSLLPQREEIDAALANSVAGEEDGFARSGDEVAWCDLRVAYRVVLARIAAYDLLHPEPTEIVGRVAAALADAAGAALEASLTVARTRVSRGTPGGQFPREEVAATRLAIIGMGKTGARELNYVSDVDVIFVCGVRDGCEESLSEGRAVEIATRLAMQTMRGISGTEIEPGLWEVDANLRPEGKQGVLVRTLESHVSYYDRWASGWEFQALLKARPVAGDRELGDMYVDRLQPRVWAGAGREGFVEDVQRMRERVTSHIPTDEIAHQLKLGPGGIRDVEFTVQLIQLVHGFADPSIRQRSTLEALEALDRGEYIDSADAAVFARDYRVLRVLEHRVQLRALRRTHLMPTEEAEQRVLARATRLAENAEGVVRVWEHVRREVRDIHVRLFYRPLLSAVAALPMQDRVLSPDQARDRLAAIGFRDAAGALRHIGALTSGLSRTAALQRHLMPVMIRWFAEGADPDYGLLAFRRLSERLRDAPWFLATLRDSAGAAERLARSLSASRYIGELIEWIPEAAAWLDDPADLRPRSGAMLQQEARAIQTRHQTIDGAMRAVRALRRREMLRMAMAVVAGTITLEELAHALTTITEVTIQAMLRAVRREVVPPEDDDLDFSIIAMGRFGGAELGFGSDADVMYVYRANGVDPQRASQLATKLVHGLRDHSEDQRLPLELDAGLRPEGRNGPLVRSIEAYAAYYERWSLSWEAQALLRARGIAGSVKLIRSFTELADRFRYPTHADPSGLREIRRIKARVENERLPRGVDPARHLKLGPGGLSDVEWLVQVIQLEHAAHEPALRTTATLGALEAAVAAGIVAPADAELLTAAWRLAGRLRSANTLLSGKTSDVLPTDRRALDGIGLLLEYPEHAATQVEEDWLAASRRARRAFEHLFYG